MKLTRLRHTECAYYFAGAGYAADNGMFVTIPLVPGVAAAVNGLLGSGRISMGGRIKTFDGTHIDELLFAFTNLVVPHMVGKSPMLVITRVPEPCGGGSP